MAGLLEGKAAVITGAGGGLGRAYALACAAEGANIVVNDVDPELAQRTTRELHEMGAGAITVAGDISDPATARGLVEACTCEYGQIDGLVNNAGISRAGLSWKATDEEVAQLFAVNVTGVIAATSAALPEMIDRGTGAIVNIISGAVLGMPGLVLYGGTKGAVLGLTYGWALEVAGTGVRVNTLSPLARTGMSDLMTDIPEEFKGPGPDRIAPVVAALLSDELSHINGQVIRFDGEHLGFMSPPGKGAGTRQESWTPRTIANSFAGELAGHTERLGLGARPEQR